MRQDAVELSELFIQPQNFYIEWDLYQKNMLLQLLFVELSISQNEDKEKLLLETNTEQFDIIYNLNLILKSEMAAPQGIEPCTQDLESWIIAA